jgi:hypothetical protein
MTNPFEKPVPMTDEEKAKALFEGMKKAAMNPLVEETQSNPSKQTRLNTGAGAMDEWQKKQEEKEDEHWEKAA